MTQMRIEKLVLKGLNQFRNLHLDFRDPKTGEPLDKVCFIGPNGTGKTTLLEVLRYLSFGEASETVEYQKDDGFCAATILLDGERYVFAGSIGYVVRSHVLTMGQRQVFSAALEDDPDWIRAIHDDSNAFAPLRHWSRFESSFLVDNSKRAMVIRNALLTETKNAISATLRSDSATYLPDGLPQTTLDAAIKQEHKNGPARIFSVCDAPEFWNLLIFQMKRRDEEWQQFLQLPENRRRTVAEVEEGFDRTHPEILAEIAKLWARILDKAGLEFDVSSAKRPTQLTENLEAFVRVKNTGKVLTDYNVLSSGMRNFLFRLGHVFALYFNRKIERGFLFVDEPEDSLYPDFLYDLIDIYLDIIKGQNTQFFVATHNPIIAAQFKPEERFILNFDESYHVVAKRGISPEGDDPNDLLDKDFAVASLYGKAGLANWERFIELRRQIDRETDKSTKLKLADEYMAIGNAYNFSPDEIPNRHALP